MAKLGDPRAIEPLCALLLGDFATVGRYAAAKALTSFHDERAFDSLCKALNDPGSSDYNVAYYAAVALGAIGSPRAIDPLVKLVDWNDSFSRRSLSWAAATALGDIRDRQAVAPLCNFLRRHPNAELRRMAAESLGRLGFIDALPELLDRSRFLFGDRSGSVRKAAKEAIAKIQSSSAGR